MTGIQIMAWLIAFLGLVYLLVGLFAGALYGVIPLGGLFLIVFGSALFIRDTFRKRS